MTLHEAFGSWEIALQSRDRKAVTINSYRDTIDVFAAWLTDNGGPDDIEAITADLVRRFLTAERLRTTPGNAHKHYRTSEHASAGLR